MAKKHSVPMATHSFPVPAHLISMFVIFSSKNVKQGHKPQTQDNVSICLLGHAYQVLLKISKWNGKGGQKNF